MTRRAAVRIALLLTAAVLMLPSLAAADGDPASDTLLGLNVFYPYSPPVAPSVKLKLNRQTAAAKRAGFPIKVALIAAPTDLGAIPSLFGKPQAYAKFLDQEISFRGAQPLLVVMPAGYGVQGVPEAARRAVSALPTPAGRTSTDLARAAQTAVAKLVSASGHSVKSTKRAGGGGGSGGGTTVLLILLVLAAIAVSTALVVLRVRRSSTG
ncbi:MAG TPA: hypothetical protein VHW04_06905 [Solirubrobacteraceae bacterium]|nr:hypothetical protein [Solirubrobacteraceae bacterium]